MKAKSGSRPSPQPALPETNDYFPVNSGSAAQFKNPALFRRFPDSLPPTPRSQAVEPHCLRRFTNCYLLTNL
ncbi:MAG: hypothetical protein AAFX40_05120 [Cyanobacteria bacterium J06639_1]